MRSMPAMFTIICASAILVTINSDALSQGVAIGRDKADSITLDMPATPGRLDQAISRMRAVTGSQIGLELLPQAKLAPREARRVGPPEQRLMLSGLTITDALNVIVRAMPEYEIRTYEGIPSVVPRSVRRSGDFLDQPVSSFDAEMVTMVQALGLFHRLFNPDYQIKEGAQVVGLSAPDDDVSQQGRIRAAAMAKKFSVHVRNVSARDVLDAICASHGEISWQVTYSDDPLSYSNARISLITPNGSRLQ